MNAKDDGISESKEKPTKTLKYKNTSKWSTENKLRMEK